MPSHSNSELDEILRRIDSGENVVATYRPERLHAEPGRDIISVPNHDGTTRRVYEKTRGGEWKEVPFLGGKSDFE